MLTTPVAFIIFNRPDLTQLIFEAIAKAQPRQVLVIADGPRFEEEKEKCEQTRAVIEQVDWECEVSTNFSEENLGCKRRVSSGIDWVFNRVEEAIILEDDCLPDPSFFYFCEQLLERYRDEPKVMHISGDNFQEGHRRTDSSYYFSKYAHVWGWATWKRAWKLYDVTMSSWPQSEMQMRKVHKKSEERLYWNEVFDRVHAGQIDTWDYQWLYSCWLNDGISILPENNLVSNLGFRSDATHTTLTNNFSKMESSDIGEIIHPSYIVVNQEADEFTYAKMFGSAPQSRKNRVQRIGKRVLSALFSGDKAPKVKG